jgi:hypothetical protein
MRPGFSTLLAHGLAAGLVIACAKDKTAVPPEKKAAAAAPRKKNDEAEASGPQSSPEKVVLMGAAGAIPLEIPDFDTLDLTAKKRLVAMTEATAGIEAVNFAMAGSDVLRARTVIKGILKAGNRVPDSIREKLLPYADRFFLNVGPLDTFTGARIRPGFIPGELAAAAKAALDSGIDLGIEAFEGADLGANRLEQLEALLASIHDVIFGPKKGEDAPLPEETDDTQVEDADRKDADQKVFEASLERVTGPLAASVAALEGAEKETREALLQYAAEPSDDRFSTFVGKYLDLPLGETELFLGPIGPARASAEGDASVRRFEGVVAVADRDEGNLLTRLTAEIPELERRLPGNAMFRRSKKDIVLPQVAAFHLVTAQPFGAISLPLFRFPGPAARMVGAPSKVMIFTNVLDAEDKALGDVLASMLSATGEARSRISKWRRAAATAFWTLKATVGYELGTRKQPGDPVKPVLRWQSSPLAVVAEMHADLAALHFAFDPKVRAIGLVPEPECGLAVLDGYLARFLSEAPIDPDLETAVGRSIVARRIVVRQLMEAHGVGVSKEDGHYVVTVEDEDTLRTGIAHLLADAQRMVSLREEKTGARLIEEKGVALPRTWREDVSKRFASLGLPVQWTFLYPELKAFRDDSGAINRVNVANGGPKRTPVL